MGESYLLTNNPMKGIQAINAVLEDDSTFVPARFQKGLALLQINRLDQAIQQFEMVKQNADEQEPFYKQAERAIEVIRKQTSTSGTNTGG
jgi:cytochrome c-type biogenesis protein CcmH/NrfG